MRFSRSAVVSVALILAVGCGGEQGGEMRAVSPRAIVQAFDRAGLEPVDKGPIAPNEFGVAPRLTEKTRRFLIRERLHQVLLDRLNAAGAIDWSAAVIDGSHVRALQGGPNRALAG